jgi:hypothetical protein
MSDSSFCLRDIEFFPVDSLYLKDGTVKVRKVSNDLNNEVDIFIRFVSFR